LAARTRHASFLLLVGIIGWVGIACTAAAPGAWPAPAAALLFLAVVAGARALAFPLSGLDGDTEVSLDSALFVAAAACLGVRGAALGLGALMSVVAAWRVRSGSYRGPRVAYVLYFGGLSGGLLAAWGRLFTDGAEWRVPLVGGAFLVSHYLVQTFELRLGGRSWTRAVQRNVRGILAEAALLPLAAAIVLLWSFDRLVPFALLGVTYLLVNFGFRRMAHLAAALRARLRDLETLHRTADALGASLELPALVSSLLRELGRTITVGGGAARVEAVLARGSDGRPELYTWVPGAADATRTSPDAAHEAWLKLREPVVEAEFTDGHPIARAHVPLRRYGETLGVLSVERRAPDGFGAHTLALLEAIGAQAAAAVENARLYALANIDGLTGLYCRRYFDVRIAEEIERARRFGSTFALILADLDDFKRLNDTLGHVAGDRALREVSAIAASQLRGVDLAARYGGEELAFLLPRTSLADAHAVAERIREAIATYSLVESGRAGMRVTASLGIAGWDESGAGDAPALVARADAALYRAKALGKNRVEIDLLGFELTPALAPVVRRRRA
jgi:diguanylate cyclase (GGDEF)-like protein